MAMAKQVEFIVVGGPNGSGKSTFIREMLLERPMPYLCADDIARELAPDNPSTAQLEAGREFLLRVDDHLSRCQTCVVETTLSGRTFTNILWKAVAEGMHISMVYMFAASPDTSVARVRQRVRKGGHHVPEEDIRRRFNRSVSNFWNYYRRFANAWVLLDNAGIEPQEIGRQAGKAYEIRNTLLHQNFLSFVENPIGANEANLPCYVYDLAHDVARIARRAMQTAQQESRDLGVPNVYSIDGILYYELPYGELTPEDSYRGPSAPNATPNNTQT